MFYGLVGKVSHNCWQTLFVWICTLYVYGFLVTMETKLDAATMQLYRDEFCKWSGSKKRELIAKLPMDEIEQILKTVPITPHVQKWVDYQKRKDTMYVNWLNDVSFVWCGPLTHGRIFNDNYVYVEREKIDPTLSETICHELGKLRPHESFMVDIVDNNPKIRFYKHMVDVRHNLAPDELNEWLFVLKCYTE